MVWKVLDIVELNFQGKPIASLSSSVMIKTIWTNSSQVTEKGWSEYASGTFQRLMMFQTGCSLHSWTGRQASICRWIFFPLRLTTDFMACCGSCSR